MINFTSMATGFQNRGDENRIERRKVAEAFEQFKQNNPEATLAQFQQYIDSVSGGRNYLAGGAGSGETLRKLGEEVPEEQGLLCLAQEDGPTCRTHQFFWCAKVDQI